MRGSGFQNGNSNCSLEFFEFGLDGVKELVINVYIGQIVILMHIAVTKSDFPVS